MILEFTHETDFPDGENKELLVQVDAYLRDIGAVKNIWLFDDNGNELNFYSLPREERRVIRAHAEDLAHDSTAEIEQALADNWNELSYEMSVGK